MDWYCPNCEAEAHTVDEKLPYHPCPKLPGLMSPLVRKGLAAKVEIVERGDWVGKELVQADANGRPVMAIKTTRDEGEDLVVLAPCAQGGGQADGLG